MMPIRLFLCGDVMLGRGVDQILPNRGDPRLRESGVRDARDYLALTVEKHGPIARPVDFRYIWGDALTELDEANPDFRIVNLETTVTASNTFRAGKAIHYRMNPKNVPCLTAARIDCAVLANNHMLDFGYQGLAETLTTLDRAGIKTAGAGTNAAQAAAPAILPSREQKRVLVYAYGHSSSGVDLDQSAELDKPGLNVLADFSDASLHDIRKKIANSKHSTDVAILSLHWGSNWGYAVEEVQRQFAHKLIDEAGVDVVYGHSSHHVKAIERHRGKIIFYGCGDFIDDYEGISGYETFRGDLRLMYFLAVSPTDGTLTSLEMAPMQIRHFRLQRAARNDAQWLYQTLSREGEKLGTKFDLTSKDTLRLA